MDDLVISITTTNREREARKLARQLVEQKLAACVNVIPKIRSFYEWDGEIHDDAEFLLLIKSPRAKLDLVKGFIDRTHTYEVPELITIDVVDALPDYMQWVLDVTT